MKQMTGQYGGTKRHMLRFGLGIMALFMLASGACLVDADDPCGESQELNDDGYCVCVEGTVLDEDSSLCQACGENEEAVAGACVCVEATFRDPSSGICVGAIPGLGRDCLMSADDCPDPLACQSTGGVDGYCTLQGCTDSSSCVAGYACDTSTSPSHCMRPPVGQGQACTSAADCADTEALYCDTFMSRTCLVQGCDLSNDDCFEGWGCCDFSTVGAGTLCIEGGSCPF